MLFAREFDICFGFLYASKPEMIKVTKRELVEIVARKAHLTKRASREAIDVFLNEIGRTLAKGVGSKVLLSGFGTFMTKRMEGKTVKIPGTETLVTIKPHRSPRFTPGKKFKKQVAR